jgi:hypothetical protein
MKSYAPGADSALKYARPGRSESRRPGSHDKNGGKRPVQHRDHGSGGQGNVMASRVLSNMLVRKGFRVTIGETFGMSQRGGSVMSHIRVSRRRYGVRRSRKGWPT